MLVHTLRVVPPSVLVRDVVLRCVVEVMPADCSGVWQKPKRAEPEVEVNSKRKVRSRSASQPVCSIFMH